MEKLKEYYPKYLSVHQNVWNRRLHLLGNIITIIFTVFVSVNVTTLWFLLPLIPFIIYPFAWSGHVFIEKNKPATWRVNPLLTKTCDWIMCYQMLTGKLHL